MSRTVTVRARMASGLKSEVEALLEQLGVTTTDAINMFFSQIRLRKGIPFSIDMPNTSTRRTFENTDRGEELHAYKNLDEMFKALDK
ncbi:MAG: type II toxin-antitoxin system RelB/DinJ family antitoxin [Lentisphaerota bacterium]